MMTVQHTYYRCVHSWCIVTKVHPGMPITTCKSGYNPYNWLCNWTIPRIISTHREWLMCPFLS